MKFHKPTFVDGGASNKDELENYFKRCFIIDCSHCGAGHALRESARR